MEALGPTHHRQRRNLIVLAVALVLTASALAVWQSQDRHPPGREPRAGLAGSGVLELRPTGARSPVKALDVPLAAGFARRARGGGLLTDELATTTFSMLGLTWRGPSEPRIRVRTRSVDGRWSSWRDVPHLHDLPDVGSGEADPDLGATDAIWVGPSVGVQAQVQGGSPRDLELALIDPGTAANDGDAAAAARPRPTWARLATTTPTRAPKPPLKLRRDWGADPAWRSGDDSFVSTVRQVHVHHTVSSNGYTPEEVPAMIRGMYRYHTQNLGWSDIGYNFLVDRFGRIWIGRKYSGKRTPVRGAHTLGFNHVSSGVSVIGEFERAEPSYRARSALVWLGAWILDRYGRNPVAWTVVRSEGSDRYAAGSTPRLPVVDGHRDTNETACPGTHLYRLLPKIRNRMKARVDRFNP